MSLPGFQSALSWPPAMRFLSSLLSPCPGGPAFLTLMRRASSGTMQVKDPLNFWGGRRVQLSDVTSLEPVYEPATGNHLFQPV